MVKPSVLKDPPDNLSGVFQQAKVNLSTLKTTYNSNVMFCADEPNDKGEYPHLIFDLVAAKAKFEGSEVQINGQWCPLFIQPVSKTTCKVGAQFRGVNVPPATGLRKSPAAPKAPKAPKAKKDLASDLGVPDLDKQCGLPAGN